MLSGLTVKVFLVQMRLRGFRRDLRILHKNKSDSVNMSHRHLQEYSGEFDFVNPLDRVFSMVARDEILSPNDAMRGQVQDPEGRNMRLDAYQQDHGKPMNHERFNVSAERGPTLPAGKEMSAADSSGRAAAQPSLYGTSIAERGFAEPHGTSIAFDNPGTEVLTRAPAGTQPRSIEPNRRAQVVNSTANSFARSTEASPSLIDTFRNESPSLHMGPSERADLDRMSNSDLANYLDDHGAPTETLELIVSERWNGFEWASTIDPLLSPDSLKEIWKMLGISSLIMRTRLLIDVREAHQKRREVENMKREQHELQFIGAKERRAFEVGMIEIHLGR